MFNDDDDDDDDKNNNNNKKKTKLIKQRTIKVVNKVKDRITRFKVYRQQFQGVFSTSDGSCEPSRCGVSFSSGLWSEV